MKKEKLEKAFNYLEKINVERCELWHPGGLVDWSPLEWAGAMCGEAGEAANEAKKLKRIDDGLENIGVSRAETVRKLGDEIADTFFYLQLLAAREGINMYEAIARKFNATSIRYSFPQRLPEASE